MKRSEIRERALKLSPDSIALHPGYAGYAWQGNIHGAIEQLELAKQAGGSFYELSTIESDLRELREMLDAQTKK